MAAALFSTFICLLVLFILAVAVIFGSGIKNIPKNEQWVITRLGDTTVKGPGRFFQIPLIDHIVKVDMGEKPVNVQDQTCITKDRAPAIIHMLVYAHAVDPVKYASQTNRQREDFMHLASSTLKETVSVRKLGQILSAREELGAAICDRLNAQIDPALGMQVQKVKVMEIVVSKEILATKPPAGELPAECPACGAPVNGQTSRGADQVKCEYCGFLIQL
jgi:regulator of protease activity HflC (stomatin/prohibitin superfamily)